jgi:hypothetical protein
VASANTYIDVQEVEPLAIGGWSHFIVPQTRAELEEIAIVEADVARLKQKVAELHLQLSLQKQQQGGSLTDASERHERVRNLQSQQ